MASMFRRGLSTGQSMSVSFPSLSFIPFPSTRFFRTIQTDLLAEMTERLLRYHQERIPYGPCRLQAL